jgi:hypothetical protein
VISVTCAQCGEPFEIGDEFAGVTEFCPFCGALNDIPNPETDEPDEPPLPDQPVVPVLETAARPLPGRGIPSVLWWFVLITALAGFLIVCLDLFSPTWESRNLQVLTDAANRGDVLMVDNDYAGAAAQYTFVIDRLGQRNIESIYLKSLLERARRGELDAQRRLRAGPTTAVSPQSPNPTTAPSPAPSQPQHYLAIESFQRNFEAFAAFVRTHTTLFQDSHGNWRRRRYAVWNTAYDPPQDSDSPRILIRYDCGSRITEPHSSRADAQSDDAFINDESPRQVHCQTQFEYLQGRWLIARRDAQVDPNQPPAIDVRSSLDDLYDIERRAFHANQSLPNQ